MLRIGVIFILVLVLSCKVDEKITCDILVKNGTIIDLETGNVSSKNILIRDGRIIEIIPVDSPKNIVAMETIDATDQYILPGFWDNHVHFRGGDSLIVANKEFLSLFLANGITTVRDAGGDLTTAVLEWKDDIATGKLAGPTILHPDLK